MCPIPELDPRNILVVQCPVSFISPAHHVRRLGFSVALLMFVVCGQRVASNMFFDLLIYITPKSPFAGSAALWLLAHKTCSAMRFRLMRYVDHADGYRNGYRNLIHGSLLSGDLGEASLFEPEQRKE